MVSVRVAKLRFVHLGKPSLNSRCNNIVSCINPYDFDHDLYTMSSDY